MSVDTLQSSYGRMSVPPVVTTSPLRLLTKGPEYFRRPEGGGVSRPSAVERLEADKAKYVKSQQVKSTRQEPVVCRPVTPNNSPMRLKIVSTGALTIHATPTKPLTNHCRPLTASPSSTNAPSRPLSNQTRALAVSIGSLTSPTRQMPISLNPSVMPTRQSTTHTSRPLQLAAKKAQRPEARGGNLLNLEALSNLINVCEGPALVAHGNTNDSAPGSPVPLSRAPQSPPTDATRMNVAGMAVRRVDVRPAVVQGTTQPGQMHQLLWPPPRRPSVQSAQSAQSPPPPSTTSSSSLQRSKSDLSDRFSRVPADLERFFNYCGLDPSEAEGLAHANSDITSLSWLISASAPGSEQGGRSHGSKQGREEEPEVERAPYGLSVIERNARVIKWLYGLRQAWGK